MTYTSFLSKAAALTAAVALFRSIRRQQARGRAGQPKTQPEYLQTWEGEGGGLPEGPATAAAPANAAPGTGGNGRSPGSPTG